MKTIALLALLALPLLGSANDKNKLLEAEYGYISELLTMGLPKVAQKHLDIIQSEFPEQRKEIFYYQAHISFRQAKYPKAIISLERLIKQKPSPAQLSEARKMLTLAYLRIHQFEDATNNLKLIKPFGGKKSWYAETCVELAEAQAAGFAKKNASKRVELKKPAFDLFTHFITTFPKNDQTPWITFFVAEYEYDMLVGLLYKLGRLKDEASPDIQKEKKKAIIIQLHKARKVYQSIKESSPKHAVIKRVEPRLLTLLNWVDKLKRDESFLPKEK